MQMAALGHRRNVHRGTSFLCCMFALDTAFIGECPLSCLPDNTQANNGGACLRYIKNFPPSSWLYIPALLGVVEKEKRIHVTQ